MWVDHELIFYSSKMFIVCVVGAMLLQGYSIIVYFYSVQ